MELSSADLLSEKEVFAVCEAKDLLEGVEVPLVVCLGGRVPVPGPVVLGLCVEFLLESGQGGGDAAGMRHVFEGVYCEPGEVVLEGGFGEAVFGGLGPVSFGGVGEDAAEVEKVVAEVLGGSVHGVGVDFFPVSFLVEPFLGVVQRASST